MAEGSSPRGQSKSRSALGDVTNRIGKRGFSGREKDGVRSFDFNDKDAVKRICVSPRPCSEINSLKGNVISGLSKIPVENREPNLYDVCDGAHSLKKDDVIGNLKFNAGSDRDKILDFTGASVVNVSINELSDGCGKSELSKNSLPRVDEVAGQNRVDPNLANLEGGKGLNSVANEADGCSPLDSSKENNILGTADVASENRSSSLDFGIHDAIIHSVNTEANDEMGESSHADTSRTVSETGIDCDVGEENISPEGTQSEKNDHHNDLDDHNADNFVLSQSGSIDCTVLPQSQESRVFGIDKSNELKEDECALTTVGSNAINACSCSFCTKGLAYHLCCFMAVSVIKFQ